MRPMLERIDHTVRHLSASGGDPSAVPDIKYGLGDCWADFWSNPGGVFRVGGSVEPDEYPVIEPRGYFPPLSGNPQGKVALIGHSAGGWISRVYLSDRQYGGKAYDGTSLIHSLVTLGSPHGDAPGDAFRGVAWVNRADEQASLPSRGVRCLAVAATGSPGGAPDAGQLTQNAYAFCIEGSDGSDVDGDGITPTQSALALQDAETVVIDGATHFPWGDVFGGDVFAPEMTEKYQKGKPWYGSIEVLDQWAPWLLSRN